MLNRFIKNPRLFYTDSNLYSFNYGNFGNDIEDETFKINQITRIKPYYKIYLKNYLSANH